MKADLYSSRTQYLTNRLTMNNVLKTRVALVSTILMLTLTACSEEMPTGPNAPTAVITAPASGLAVQEGAPVPLAGSAIDPQDGPLGGAALAWSSSIDGALGTGSALEVTLPSTGVHTITLTATDADGNTGDAAVSVLVEKLEFLDGTVGEPAWSACRGVPVQRRGRPAGGRPCRWLRRRQPDPFGSSDSLAAGRPHHSLSTSASSSVSRLRKK